MRVLVVLVLLLLPAVAGCSLNLGAEKLNLDAKTAKASAPAVTAPPSVVSQREDQLVKRAVYA